MTMTLEYRKPKPFWKTNKAWYTFDLQHGYRLTDEAPPEARASFKECRERDLKTFREAEAIHERRN